MRATGWNTNCSGFGDPKRSQFQEIQFSGGVLLDENVRRGVEATGARLSEELYPKQVSYSLSFEPETADIDAITEQWNRVAACIPDLGRPFVSQRNPWTDTAFVINALNIGLCADQLAPLPFATESAIQETMAMYNFSSRQEHRPLV